MIRRKSNSPLVAILVIAVFGLGATVVAVLLLNSSRPSGSATTAQSKKTSRKSREVTEDQIVAHSAEAAQPDAPARPPLASRTDPDAEFRRLRELKEVRQAIESDKNRIAILEKKALLRASASRSIERSDTQGIASIHEAQRDSEMLAELKRHLSALLDKETELELKK